MIAVNRKLFLLLAILSVALRAQIARESGDFKAEVVAIVSAMPGSGSEGFTPPSFATLQQWTPILLALCDGEFQRADSLVRADFPSYQIVEFTDTGYGDAVYYLLRENAPVQKGWGTYAVNPNFRRAMAIEVPHARYDTNTHREGSDVFRETGARFFLMSGTHRCANSAESICDGTTGACGSSGSPYRVSDMAHYEKALFQLFHEVLTIRNPTLYAVNLHGHANSDCQDFFMSSGVGSTPSRILLDIKASLLASGGVSAAVAGDGTSTCTLTGGTNVQGRYTNGSSDPCAQAAGSPNGYFMHIEQARRIRDSYDLYSRLIGALNEHIQPVTGIADAPVSRDFVMLEAFPNPFNPAVTLALRLSSREAIRLTVFDALGREVTVLARGIFGPGEHRFVFEGEGLSGGVYFAFLQGEGHRQVKRLVLAK
ncbi:MAG: hypothetical protein KDI06_15405 [Calditrichaeota bacterium]|nr:hypothetical protein [Calditrichota bacterium]